LTTSNYNRTLLLDKGNIMENVKKGTCGCGRSPTGDCIGWHSLSEDMYQHQKGLWLEEQFRKDAEAEENNNDQR